MPLPFPRDRIRAIPRLPCDGLGLLVRFALDPIGALGGFPSDPIRHGLGGATGKRVGGLSEHLGGATLTLGPHLFGESRRISADGLRPPFRIGHERVSLEPFQADDRHVP